MSNWDFWTKCPSGFIGLSTFLLILCFYSNRMMYFIAAINFCYAPLMFFLRHLPPTSAQTEGGVEGEQQTLTSTTTTNQQQKQIILNTPLIYEKIEGINDPQLLYGNEQQKRQTNGFNSVWDD